MGERLDRRASIAVRLEDGCRQAEELMTAALDAGGERGVERQPAHGSPVRAPRACLTTVRAIARIVRHRRAGGTGWARPSSCAWPALGSCRLKTRLEVGRVPVAAQRGDRRERGDGESRHWPGRTRGTDLPAKGPEEDRQVERLRHAALAELPLVGETEEDLEEVASIEGGLEGPDVVGLGVGRVPEAVVYCRRDGHRLARSRPELLPVDPERELARDDLEPAHLLGMGVVRLPLFARWAPALDPQGLTPPWGVGVVAPIGVDEAHPLSGALVDDERLVHAGLLGSYRHDTLGPPQDRPSWRGRRRSPSSGGWAPAPRRRP